MSSGAPAPLPSLGLLLETPSGQGGDPAPLPHLGLLLGAAPGQGGAVAPFPWLGLLTGASPYTAPLGGGAVAPLPWLGLLGGASPAGIVLGGGDVAPFPWLGLLGGASPVTEDQPRPRRFDDDYLAAWDADFGFAATYAWPTSMPVAQRGDASGGAPGSGGAVAPLPWLGLLGGASAVVVADDYVPRPYQWPLQAWDSLAWFAALYAWRPGGIPVALRGDAASVSTTLAYPLAGMNFTGLVDGQQPYPLAGKVQR